MIAERHSIGKYDDLVESDDNEVLIQIPPIFQDKHYDVDKGNKRAWDFAVDLINGKISKGLYLYGPAGSGKSHLAAHTLKEWASKNRTNDVMYVSYPDLLLKLQSNMAVDNSANYKLIRDMCETKMLVLDDLGAEKTSEWSNSMLYIIIDERYGNLRPTIVTTNCGETEQAKRIGDRLVSRLHAMCNVVEIVSEDRRLISD